MSFGDIAIYYNTKTVFNNLLIFGYFGKWVTYFPKILQKVGSKMDKSKVNLTLDDFFDNLSKRN